DVTEWVRLLQLGSAGAAAWLLLWLALWRRLVPADSEPGRKPWGAMLTAQMGLAVAGPGAPPPPAGRRVRARGPRAPGPPLGGGGGPAPGLAGFPARDGQRLAPGAAVG